MSDYFNDSIDSVLVAEEKNGSGDPSFLKDFGQAVLKVPNGGRDVELPNELYCMPIRSRMVYPGLMAPLFIIEKHHLVMLNKLMVDHGIVGLIVPREGHEDKQTLGERQVFRYGVAVKVLKKVNLPDEGSHVLVQGLKRFRIQEVLESGQHIFASVQYLEDKLLRDQETEALMRALIYQVKELAQTQPLFSDEMRLAMVNTHHPGELADLVAYTIPMTLSKINKYLSISNVKKRLSMVLVELKREYELLELQKKIQSEVNDKITKVQREFFLKEQLRQIQQELGMKQDEQSKAIERYRVRLDELTLPKEPLDQIEEHIDKLEHMSDMSPEYQVLRNYLEYILFLPWGETTEECSDIKAATRELNKTHYGLQKIKERILEFLAVRKLNPQYAGSVLCLVGPPGCGKTSLGESIAKAMGRKFFRFSLGGMRDEAEIKGHRRTYVGAMPGKIIEAMKRVGSQNPVILMDEIDKLGISYQGDPAAALLEVFDPEQNHSFLDHYIDVPFDLSKVLFIVTANVLEEIPEPLVDRMEVIEVHGYNEAEKLFIAKKHLVPKLLKKHGLKQKDFRMPDSMMKFLISDYAREAGVRYLDQCLATLMRKQAFYLVAEKQAEKVKWQKGAIAKILGPSVYREQKIRTFKRPGMAYGLAWTPVGGDILTIECVAMPSTAKKGGYTITGQIGDVMNESAHLAHTFAMKYAHFYGASSDFFREHELHIHVPAGAIPKDGPSAGVVLLSVLISLATGQVMPPKLAMTGEISLSGDLLPVGGIKEKLLAARREGLKTVFLPKENKADVDQLEKGSKSGLKLLFFNNVRDILSKLFK